METDRTFELAIVMAGAISAGAYSAGVLDFLFEALDAYDEAKQKPDWTGPTHDVRVPVMTGASAGGMTASVCALHAFHDLAHVWPGRPVPPPRQNRLYSSWVTDISLDRLLETSDLDADQTAGVKSALCCDVLDRIVDKAFHMTGGPRERNWIGRGEDRSLRLFVTLTNLRGVPYSFELFGNHSGETYGMLNHGDYFEYKVGLHPKVSDASMPLDINNTNGLGWSVFRTTALATGAFPLGLKPRVVEREVATYYREAATVGYQDPITGQFVVIPPDGGFGGEKPYRFISVDGGVIDNAPLELARRYLSRSPSTHDNPNGEEADKAVLLIAPFPNFAQSPPPDEDVRLIHVLSILGCGLIDQARFKPEELQRAADDTCFSRFMISPTRHGNGTPEATQFPIASGVLGGFGGFLHESFRRHDYLLGRRNAQAFLRWNFALPESNKLFGGAPIDGERWHVRSADGQKDTLPAGADERLPKKQFAGTVGGTKSEFGLPIIPLVDRLLEPIVIGADDQPKPRQIDVDHLRRKLKGRADKVIARLVDVDLSSEIKGLWWGGLASMGAKWFGAQVATKKAMSVIENAIEQVVRAF